MLWRILSHVKVIFSGPTDAVDHFLSETSILYELGASSAAMGEWGAQRLTAKSMGKSHRVVPWPWLNFTCFLCKLFTTDIWKQFGNSSNIPT